MERVDWLIFACRRRNVKEVRRIISEGVDINGQDSDGKTGLMVSMSASYRTETARILLGHNNIKLDIKNKDGRTALHFACRYDQAESVKLFLAHPDCNKDIVEIKNNNDRTAEMIAEDEDCARLIMEYLESIDKEGDENSKLEDLAFPEVARRIEELDANESTVKEKLKDDLKEELAKLETNESLLQAKLEDDNKKELDGLTAEHINEMKKIEAEYKRKCEKRNDEHANEIKSLKTEFKRKRDVALEKHDAENKRFCSKNEKTKKALHQDVEKRLARSAGATGPPSSTPPPPSPASLIPSCPVCFETMKPPFQIFTSGNGHLICSSCKPEVSTCYCQAKFTGRATAMEQMVRMILNIN